MKISSTFKNSNFVLFIAIILILLIGFIDYITHPEISFSLFYIIIIALLAVIDGIRLTHVIIAAIISSFLWFYADFTSIEYQQIIFSFWNAFVRLCIFIFIGVLLIRNKEKVKLLKIANEKQKALNEEKNNFVGIAAHDLRSPMGNIHSFSDLLLSTHKNQMDDDMTEIIHLIKRLSKNGLDLVDNLLDVSKIESGKLALNFKKQDFISFIKDQVYLSQLLAAKKDISIIFESNEEQIFSSFDENYLNEVIDNLLSNAIKYSPKGSHITVKIYSVNNQTVRTDIIDHGFGIIKEEQDKLFKYFQKSSTKPTDGESSTGLGLAIAKRIVSEHHGEIGVHSIVNEGSTFYFTLPIA
ncbi:MAG: HAMP domain-containing histidine kinase [Salinivirgaceae bacterium]|nr:HAMP domain-containing histidine kinase [Salinivirgaceae bacterium]